MDGLKAFLRHPWTIRTSQILIGSIFIYAALPKIGDLNSFAGQVHNYRLVPIPLENLFTMSLPWIELVVGLALVLGIQARAGAVLATAFMVMFMIAIAQAMARGLDIDCGCFGTSDAAKVGLSRLGQDVGFLVLALIGMLRVR